MNYLPWAEPAERFLERTSQDAGWRPDPGGGAEKKGKEATWLDLIKISLQRQKTGLYLPQIITTVFFFFLQVINRISHCCTLPQDPIKAQGDRMFSFLFSVTPSKTPGFGWGEPMITQILLGISCFVLPFCFCLAPKKKKVLDESQL